MAGPRIKDIRWQKKRFDILQSRCPWEERPCRAGLLPETDMARLAGTNASDSDSTLARLCRRGLDRDVAIKFGARDGPTTTGRAWRDDPPSLTGRGALPAKAGRMRQAGAGLGCRCGRWRRPAADAIRGVDVGCTSARIPHRRGWMPWLIRLGFEVLPRAPRRLRLRVEADRRRIASKLTDSFMTTFDPSAPPPVALYDTLLRDGSQMEGIAFSLQDKIAIAHRLDALGMHYVEGGFPGSNEKDRAFFEQMRSRPLARAKLVAFGGTRKPGAEVAEDFSVAALREAGTPVVTFVGKAIASQVESVLNTSREENLAMVRESLEYMASLGREVHFDAEHFFDGFAEDPDYALQVLRTARRAGAEYLIL